jgi:hypothetical protein
MTQLRISAKNLGAFALPDFCPRCAWISLHVKNLPFQIFPGIFSSIDAYNKRIVHSYFDKYNQAPEWLHELGELTGYVNPPSWHTFQVLDPETDILLTGSADGIFTRPDGSYVIVDYKTAKYTGRQDALFPMYETQLNGYALIGKETGFDPVTGLALVYMEPVTGDEAASSDQNHTDDGFLMGFSAKVHEIERRPEILPPLLTKVRELYEMEKSPEGMPGCKDCERLDDLFRKVKH